MSQLQTMLTPGERLTIARERAGVSIGAIAAAATKHRNTPTRWEQSRKDLPLSVLRLYVYTCRTVSLEWLIDELGQSPSLAIRTRPAMSRLRRGPPPSGQISFNLG